MAADDAPARAALDDWIAREAIPFSLDAPVAFDAAVDRVVAALGDEVELLGLGEALHFAAAPLLLRNRLFRRLAEAHGYSAIAIESSFPRGRHVDDYVASRGPASFDEVRDAGFSHGFGQFAANRGLVEWMRRHNADPSRAVPLRFYGFDSPTETMFADSPRRLLEMALDGLDALDGSARSHRARIEPLLGPDAAWENPAAAMDPTQSIGRSPSAAELRIAVEDFISDLRVRLPDLAATGGDEPYLDALHAAEAARQLLNYHARMAGDAEGRFADLLGLRGAIMADNLAYIAARERGRGRVLVFAHNEHLRRGRACWQFGSDTFEWSPAGAHLSAMFGPRYAVIGTAVGVSEEHGIGRPEAGTLEARLTAAPGPGRFLPTGKGDGVLKADRAALPIRSGSAKNRGYFPLTPEHLAEFDWLAVLDSTGYAAGAPPLPAP